MLARNVSNSSIDLNLARVIEAARKRAGLSKYRLAVRSGLSPNTVRLAELGIASIRTLNALARALEVSVDELTGRKGGAP